MQRSARKDRDYWPQPFSIRFWVDRFNEGRRTRRCRKHGHVWSEPRQHVAGADEHFEECLFCGVTRTTEIAAGPLTARGLNEPNT